ncbi:hypothetical protein [Nitrososphaera viennensis]|nr:hypothetical protein [Nitrososphaera viennensis]UVS69758.1 hypothetical protein NWT39_02980 [Nitrososphaera viennensis]
MTNGLQSTIKHPYVNTVYGLSIDFPRGWWMNENYSFKTVNGDQQNAIVMFYSANVGTITVSANDLPPNPSLDAVFSDAKNTLIEKYKAYNLIILREGATTIGTNGTYDARFIEVTLTADNKLLKEELVYTIHDGKRYVLTISAPADQYPSALPLFQKSITSLAFGSDAITPDKAVPVPTNPPPSQNPNTGIQA